MSIKQGAPLTVTNKNLLFMGTRLCMRTFYLFGLFLLQKRVPQFKNQELIQKCMHIFLKRLQLLVSIVLQVSLFNYKTLSALIKVKIKIFCLFKSNVGTYVKLLIPSRKKMLFLICYADNSKHSINLQYFCITFVQHRYKMFLKFL